MPLKNSIYFVIRSGSRSSPNDFSFKELAHATIVGSLCTISISLGQGSTNIFDSEVNEDSSLGDDADF